MSEQAPSSTHVPSSSETAGANTGREWSDSEWFQTWLLLARKGGNHPPPVSVREGNG